MLKLYSFFLGHFSSQAAAETAVRYVPFNFSTDVAGYAHYHIAGYPEATGVAQLIPVGEASRSTTRRTNDSMV
jgi:hypothetical protein